MNYKEYRKITCSLIYFILHDKWKWSKKRARRMFLEEEFVGEIIGHVMNADLAFDPNKSDNVFSIRQKYVEIGIRRYFRPFKYKKNRILRDAQEISENTEPRYQNSTMLENVSRYPILFDYFYVGMNIGELKKNIKFI